MSRRFIVLGSVLFAGCSLLGLDTFELPQCASHADCDARNRAARIPEDACELYQCDPTVFTCRLGPRDRDGDGDPSVACGGSDCDDEEARVGASLAEVCDAYDNDCDGRVDEGVVELVQRQPARDLGDVRSASWSSDGVLGWTTPSDEGWWAADADPSSMTYARELDESNFMRPQLDPMDACPQLAAGAVVAGRCTFAELAVAPASSPGYFAAAIHTTGCAQGQLRIGRIDDPTRPQVVLRGPRVRSNIYLGVDVDHETSACTGASRPSRPGAARVSIATMPGAAPRRALAAWLADAVTRGACADDEVDVEVLGIFEESGRSGGTDIQWITGTNDGAPQVIGQTRGGAAPAIVGLEDAGWLVAYPTVDGTVALHRVLPSAPPPAVPADALPDDVRVTAPLALSAPDLVLESTDADAVDLAALHDGEAWRVAIAWREGCPSGAIRWALVHIGTSLEVEHRGTLVESGAGVVRVTPVLGQGPGDAAVWLVTWAEGELVRAQRFTENGDAFDAIPAEHVGGARVTSLAARGAATADQIDYVARDSTTSRAGALALECGDVPPPSEADAGP